MGPRRRVKRNHTYEANDVAFWDDLTRKSAYNDIVDPKYKEDELERRKLRRENAKHKFLKSYICTRRRHHLRTKVPDLVKTLKYWVKFHSWSYCAKCKLMNKRDLLPTSFNQKGCSFITQNKCWSCSKRYRTPTRRKIPKVLRVLSKEDEKILRIFRIDVGVLKRAHLGHRIKNGAFELRYRDETVEERIQCITDTDQRNRLEVAYEYLTNSDKSSYSQYLLLQDNEAPGSKIKFWVVLTKMICVECALWPVLYPFNRWCETFLQGEKDSILHSFRCKLLSQIIDYNNNFELLQFHYDRWLFKCVMGAVSVGKRNNTSPYKALENKSFTPAFWRWQHRYLQDGVLQYGLPTLFITFSPYEWDFPKAVWIEDLLHTYHHLPTKTGAVETLHIAHVIDQLCRGYISGCNSKLWESKSDHHLLYNFRKNLPGNVKLMFYRFEFQSRRTIHAHMLIWLSKVNSIDIDRIKASIPTDDSELAFLVHRLQSSDEGAPFLKVRKQPTEVCGDQILLHHTENDKSLHLRAYVDTILPVLQSRMDVQASDGKDALMSYVCGYVAKLAEDTELLRSTQTTPWQAMWPFLIDHHPGEPEMAIMFSSNKLSYCNKAKLKLIPPTIEFFDKNILFQKYMNRPVEAENLTALEFCRSYVVSKEIPTLAKQKYLVGVFYKYILNDRFFWEYTIVNTPFREVKELYDAHYKRLPDNVKLFSFMWFNHKDFLLNNFALTDFVSTIGYKQHVIDSFLQTVKGYSILYNRSLHDGVEEPIIIDTHVTTLNKYQKIVYNHVISKVEKRARSLTKEQYNVMQSDTDTSSDSDDEELPNAVFLRDETDDSRTDNVCVTTDFVIDNTKVHMRCSHIKYTLICGQPGTGKTYLLHRIVEHCLSQGLNICFACPTAYQAREIKQLFTQTNVTCDTIHSLFHIYVYQEKNADINWGLLKYDVIIIDEVGMVTQKNMWHVHRTVERFPVSPILILVGDPKQQQPLEGEGNKTGCGVNIFASKTFKSFCDKYSLVTQHRIKCDTLKELLKTLRVAFPTAHQVEVLNRMAMADIGCVDESVIQMAYCKYPQTTFLCITKKGCHFVNAAICDYLFHNDVPIGVQVNISQEQCIDLYEGMHILITENVNKSHGLVNGASAVITRYEKPLLFIKLKNNSNHFLHPHFTEDIGHYLPVDLNYAFTIFKSQGKTLPHITLWLDSKCLSPGSGYVALSRVEMFKDIRLLQKVQRKQFPPIKIPRDEDTLLIEEGEEDDGEQPCCSKDQQ